MNRLLVAGYWLLGTSCAFAQEKLSLEKAVEISLKNNYSISIAKNESEITKNDYSLGNAGFLPAVALTASGNTASNSTNQHYSSGQDVNKSGVKSNAINSGVALNWTVFDGMKMFATYDKLKELNDMGELNSKVQIESTLAQLISAYYDVVQQKQLQKAIEDAIEISNERVNITETKLRIGNGSYVDVLQSKVDLNEQRSLLLKQKTAITNAKTRLNQAMARDLNSAFDVDDSIPIKTNPVFEELHNTILKQNNSLLFAQKNTNVSNYVLKEINSQRYPKLGLNANYNFSRAENQAGFILLNQNLGFNAGFTASWTLFNGWNTNRQYKDARLSALNANLQLYDTRNQVEADLLSSFNNFKNALEAMNLEEENNVLAKEYADIALEKFRLASLTSLELKEAQKSFLDSESRLVAARYQAKLAETDLKRLNGELVK